MPSTHPRPCSSAPEALLAQQSVAGSAEPISAASPTWVLSISSARTENYTCSSTQHRHCVRTETRRIWTTFSRSGRGEPTQHSRAATRYRLPGSQLSEFWYRDGAVSPTAPAMESRQLFRVPGPYVSAVWPSGGPSRSSVSYSCLHALSLEVAIVMAVRRRVSRVMVVMHGRCKPPRSLDTCRKAALSPCALTPGISAQVCRTTHFSVLTQCVEEVAHMCSLAYKHRTLQGYHTYDAYEELFSKSRSNLAVVYAWLVGKRKSGHRMWTDGTTLCSYQLVIGIT